MRLRYMEQISYVRPGLGFQTTAIESWKRLEFSFSLLGAQAKAVLDFDYEVPGNEAEYERLCTFREPNLEGREGSRGIVGLYAVGAADIQTELFPVAFMYGIHKRELFCLRDEKRALFIPYHKRTISLEFPCALVAPCQPEQEIPIPDTKETGLSVTLILMDNEMNPVKLDEKRAVSTIFQAETIDESLINLLNGEKNALISL